MSALGTPMLRIPPRLRHLSVAVGAGPVDTNGGFEERAMVVFNRSRELASSPDTLEPGVVAVDLLHLARGSESTLRHAQGIGRRQVERNPGDVRARLGVRLIGAAIEFLGVRPALGS